MTNWLNLSARKLNFRLTDEKSEPFRKTGMAHFFISLFLLSADIKLPKAITRLQGGNFIFADGNFLHDTTYISDILIHATAEAVFYYVQIKGIKEKLYCNL